MAGCSSFDQWQKDVFFSAAERVQESADTMESIYRMWDRERKNGFSSDISDELRGELHTSIGTAKWQLEEFEKAVRSSHENYSADENAVTRHSEFVTALKNQVLNVEKAMNNSLLEEGRQPLRWIQLDEEERDDFEIFLSSPPQPTKVTREQSLEVRAMPESIRGFKETVSINKDARYVVEVEAKEPCRNKDEVILQEENLSGQRRVCCSADIDAWKIIIADENKEKKLVEARPVTQNRASSLCGFLTSVGCTAKSKWLRSNLRKGKSGESIESGRGFTNYLNLKGIAQFAQGINGLRERSRNCFIRYKEDDKVSNIQQIVGRTGGLQRQFQGSQYTVQFGRSLRVTLLLVLTIFLIAPFVLYST